MKKIVSLILVFTIVFATNSMVASAQTTNTVCQNGVGYKAKTYQVAGKYDTVTGIARINSLFSTGTWKISSANNGKYAYYSCGQGSSNTRFTNVRAKRLINTNKIITVNYGTFLQAVNIKFYW